MCEFIYYTVLCGGHGEGAVEEHVGLGVEDFRFGGEGDEGIVNVEPLILVPLITGVMPRVKAAYMGYNRQELVVGAAWRFVPRDTDNVKGLVLSVTVGLLLLPVIRCVSMQVKTHGE